MKKVIGYIVLISLVVGCIVGFYSFTGFYVWGNVAVNSKLIRKENTFSIQEGASNVYAEGEIINATNETIVINKNEIIIYCQDKQTNDIYSFSNALSYTIKKQEKTTIAISLSTPSYSAVESIKQDRYIAENYRIVKLEHKPLDSEAYEIMSLGETNSYFLPLGTIIVVPIVVCAIIVLLVVSNKKAKKSQQYLKDNFAKVVSISEKYSELAKNLLERFSRINRNDFHEPNISKHNTLITEYWNTNIFLGKIFAYDGFEKYSSTIYSTGSIDAKHEIKSFVEELKKTLLASGEWIDIRSIPYVAYFIIRNYSICSNDLRLRNLIPKGLENYRMELDIIATCATDNTEQSTPDNEKEIIIDEVDTEDDKQERDAKARQMRELQERIARERAEEDEKERIRQEKRKQSIANLNANKDKLILEYSNTIENFIEKLNEYSAVFLYLFNDTEIPRSSILVNPYRNQHYLFCDTVKRDGLCFSESSNAEANKTIQNLTDFLIQGLKKRIKENNEWEDEYTLPVLLYYIVRNNVVRHYHNLYLKEIGCLTLEDFCVKFTNVEIPQDWAFGYTYYYIYENDINLPFMETYKKLCAEMLKTIAEQKQRKLESDLFGTHKPKSTHTDNSFAKTLSPIEQIDLMSGQEFEIYMEAFFAQKGYKVERTPLSGDYGVDLIIEHTFGRTGVQLKCYSKKVPADAVQQIVTGLRHYKLSNGMVITNNYFQKEAITLAAENHIELWDRDKLIKELN